LAAKNLCAQNVILGRHENARQTFTLGLKFSSGRPDIAAPSRPAKRGFPGSV
jgi:hypothetical protein